MNMNELTNNNIKIQKFRSFDHITQADAEKVIQRMKKQRPAEMVFLPDFESPAYRRGLILKEYWSNCYLRSEQVLGCELIGDLYILKFEKSAIYQFAWLYHKLFDLRFYTSRWQDGANLWGNVMSAEKEGSNTVGEEKLIGMVGNECIEQNVYEQFVFTKTPAEIEKELNERVIGQPQLTSATADFLYYHAMRQINPSLPPRPMLIAGPSGTGKTEVWRVAKELYKNTFYIKIIDASRITQEGWKGDEKLSTVIDEEVVNGGILIADEFDKLSRPQYSNVGENVSLPLQSEFLKAVEGELSLTSGKNRITRNTKTMGFVFLGAFTEMFEASKNKNSKERCTIGFGASTGKLSPASIEITDQDYLEYGVMAELLGRISVKVCTNDLSDSDYIKIVNNPASRVSQLYSILSMYADNIPRVSEGKIRELIAISRQNKTGVRWVSAQIENDLLEGIHNVGIRKREAKTLCA